MSVRPDTGSMRSGVSALVALTLLVVPGAASADPGDLDPSYNEDGVALIPASIGSPGIQAAFQSDHRLVIAGGHGDLFITRVDTAGARDWSFGSATTQPGTTMPRGCGDSAAEVAVLPDDSILVLSQDCLVKLEPDGELDTSFSRDGVVAVHLATDFVVDGEEIYLVSRLIGPSEEESGVLIERIESDGRIDHGYAADLAFGSQFGFRAQITTSGSSLVVAGTLPGEGDSYEVGVVKLDSNGAVDPLFGAGGAARVSLELPYPEVEDLLVEPDGDIVLAGSVTDANEWLGYVARLKADGSTDASFGDGGVEYVFSSTDSSARSLAIDPDGNLYVGGQAATPTCGQMMAGCDPKAAIARFLPSGQLDTSFGEAGEAILDLEGHDYGTEVLLDGGLAYLVGVSQGELLVSRHLLVDVGADFDADGIADDMDACPKRFSAASDGCPTYARSIMVHEVVKTPDLLRIELSIGSLAYGCQQPERTRLQRRVDGQWRRYARQPGVAPIWEGDDESDYEIFKPKPGPYRLVLPPEDVEGVGHCEAAKRVRIG